MPVQVANYLVQLRRRDVMMRWTTPNWARADKIIREVTQAVTFCVGYVPRERQTADGTRLWRDRSLFVWRTYDAFAFDDFTEGKRQGLRARPIDLFWRPGSMAERAYDTLDGVIALGWANEAGLCMTCGGKRSHPRCGCDTHSGTARPRAHSLGSVVKQVAGTADEATADLLAEVTASGRSSRRARRAAAQLADSLGAPPS